MPDLKIVMVPIGDLKPAKYNPRKIGRKAEAELEASIRDFGLIDPLVVNGNPKRMNVVIGGHRRLLIAGRIGMPKVPAIYVELDEAGERELNLRLNKNGGEFDAELLKDFDKDLLKLVGFSVRDLVESAGGGKNVAFRASAVPRIVISFTSVDDALEAEDAVKEICAKYPDSSYVTKGA